MANYKTKKIRFGLIGLGFGSAIHLPAILDNKKIKLVGICGKSEEKTKKIAQKFNILNFFTSIDDLLKMKLDAISIALPPNEIKPILEKILKYDISILCEKPLSVKNEDAYKLSSKAINKVTSMNFIFYELETFKHLKKIIETKKLGLVKNVNVRWLTESYAFKNKKWSWKIDKIKNGGVITLMGTHLFFLLDWFFGSIDNLKANTKLPLAKSFAPQSSIIAEDFVKCDFVFKNGIKCFVRFSNSCSEENIHKWIIEFEQGIVILENSSSDYVNGFKIKIFDNFGKLLFHFNEPVSANDGRLIPFKRTLDNFVRAFNSNNTNLFPNFFTGAKVQLIDNYVRESIKQNKRLFV